MIKNKNQVLEPLIIAGIFLVFLDAYEVFSFPISWMGQVFLLSLAITQFKEYKQFFKGRLFFNVVLLLLVPQIYIFINLVFSEENLTYTALRFLNIFSFLILLAFSVNYSTNNKIDKEDILIKMKYFCFIYSIFVIYIFLAQIFDFYEPFRNRSNTDSFEASRQSIFWLSQPHRAMGTFREPSFLITFFCPLILLVVKSLKKTNIIFCVITGIALGLTRSDYIRFFSVIIFLFLMYTIYVEKKINFNFIFLLIPIIFFSTFGILECNLNPNSIDCSNYKEDVEKINGSGKIQVKSNSPSSIIELGVERLDVVSFFFGTLDNLKPNGLSSVNKNYQYYQSIKISDEMYLTNRTKNFGTGSYSVVGYEVNVQNLIVFYSQAFGVTFIVLLFLIFIDFITKNKLSVDTVYFIIIVLFFTISPIEEVNAYYGLIIGFSYGLLIKGNKYEKI
jgi:hypothetical protein